MRIALLGEFSGVHKYLKDGLLQLGHDVILVADGDGWKQFDGADFPLSRKKDKGGFFRFLAHADAHVFVPARIRRKIVNYDVVQFMSATMLSALTGGCTYEWVARHNKVFSLLLGGADYVDIAGYRMGLYDYYPYDYDKSYLRQYDGRTLRGALNIRRDRHAISCADAIIPVSFDYAKNYAAVYGVKEDVIPFPINTDKLVYHENRVGRKVVFYHGINRLTAEKGTPKIIEALRKLESKYPNDIEVIINQRLPYAEYLRALERTNVLLDQCIGIDLGMNACITMAMGKVVMARQTPDTAKTFGIETPVIEIIPDSRQIFSQLEYILDNKNKITEIGYQSRQYIEKRHHYIKVAQQYIDRWKSTGKL